jgi:predicted phage terminase large subunit-like protein
VSNQLAFQPGDATWRKLRDKGKADLYFLVDVILGYGAKIPMRRHAHDLLCRIAQGTTGSPEIDTAPVLKLLLPRGWGKSSCITIGQTLHRLIRDPESSTLICNEREQNAKDFLTEIKHHFDHNELFRALYPELIPEDKNETEWSGTRITIPRKGGRKEPSVFVIGVGGTVTGMHPDYIIVDDMISREAAENARRGSWQIMQEVNRWTHTLRDLLSNRDTTEHRTTFIGTRWYFNDCYDHVDEYFGGDSPPKEWRLTVPVEGGQKQTLPVTRRGELVEFRRAKIEDGQASWPERWDMESMAIEQAADPIHFSANSLNNPSSEESATFKPAWIKSFSWLDSHTITYITPLAVKTALQLVQLDIAMIVDPGGFGNRTTDDRARPAITVIGHTPTGEFIVLGAWSEKETYVACQKQVMTLARRYQVRKVAIEVAGQQRTFFDQTRTMLAQPIAQGGAGMNVAVQELKTEGKHKDDRILELEPFLQRGVVYIGVGPEFTELRTQLAQFPRSARRDLLDCLGYLPKVFRPRQTNQAQGQERVQAELARYYKGRGLPLPGR